MGRIVLAVSACSLAWSQFVLAEDVAPSAPPAATPIAAPAQAAPARKLITIKRDTPLDLIATREINSAKVKPGDQFTLAVNTPVTVDGATIIPFMTKATGEVTMASKAGGLGRNGAMSAHLLYLTLGEAKIPISGEVTNSGGGGGSAAMAVFFGGVLGLFHRGNDGRIKAGQRVAAFVGEDVVLDLGADPIRRIEMKLVPVEDAAPSAPAAPSPTPTPTPTASAAPATAPAGT